jgi:hypothetical protein
MTEQLSGEAFLTGVCIAGERIREEIQGIERPYIGVNFKVPPPLIAG